MKNEFHKSIFKKVAKNLKRIFLVYLSKKSLDQCNIIIQKIEIEKRCNIIYTSYWIMFSTNAFKLSKIVEINLELFNINYMNHYKEQNKN